QYLTPFGEYIPLRNIARMISPFVDDVTDFHAGKRVDKHTVDGFQMAPIICYELLSDSLVQNAARESDAIIAQTNSATFAGTSESTQQLNITRLRAMENAREIVSISTIGVSAHIDINGRVISATPENVPAVLTGNLRSNNQVTMANWLGGFAPVLVIAIFLVLPAALRIVRSR
ncbi:MAG: nitrilase-related carbon-nitrogen hydrolase, partial [Candidatus Planktophila sp.]